MPNQGLHGYANTRNHTHVTVRQAYSEDYIAEPGHRQAHCTATPTEWGYIATSAHTHTLWALYHCTDTCMFSKNYTATRAHTCPSDLCMGRFYGMVFSQSHTCILGKGKNSPVHRQSSQQSK